MHFLKSFKIIGTFGTFGTPPLIPFQKSLKILGTFGTFGTSTISSSFIF